MADSSAIDTVVRGKVSPDALMSELQDAILNAQYWSDNCRLAEDTSWCIWPGQSDDGLKHAFPGDDTPPFPWENASDTRIRLVEEKVRESSKVCMLAAKRGNWNFQGVEGFDYLKARRMSQLLRWQEAKQIPMARRERNLWIGWAHLYGCAIMGLGWETREELGLRDFTGDDLMNFFMAEFGEEEALPYIETLIQALTDPLDGDDEWLDLWIEYFFPDSSAKMRKEAIEQLRGGETATVQSVRIVAEHPTWQAMKPFEHVFFPLDTESMSTARWVANRRWLSKPELESKRGEWSDEFIDELLNHPGASSTTGIEDYNPNAASGRRRWGGRRASAFSYDLNREALYEVFYFYHRSVNEDHLPGLYCTIISPHAQKIDDDDESYIVAKQEIYDNGTGKMPFEEYTIWDDRRALLECEGIPHLIYTHQLEKKSMRDYRIDAASINILPPLRRHAKDRNLPILLGPDMPIYENVPGSTEWMSPPSSKTWMATDIERSVDREVNRLTGSYDAEVPSPVVQIDQEYAVEQFTEAFSRVLRHTFQLDQAYLPEVTVTRVTSFIGEPFKVSREEIQGQFDVTIQFDPRELDLEWSMKKFQMVTRIATELDRNSITDTNALVRMGYNMIDPAWADALVRDEFQAGEAELRETMDAVNDIVAGQQPQMKEGINAQVRLQYISQQMQTNPMLQSIAQNPEDPRHNNLMEYIKHLEFMYQQHVVNPGIGRIGVNQNQPGESTGGGY